MKKILIPLLLISLVLLLGKTIEAGDSVSFGISCVIPAIPGVNAPLLYEEDTGNTEDSSDKVDNDSYTVIAKENRNKELSTFIFQEEKVGEADLKRIRTIYQR